MAFVRTTLVSLIATFIVHYNCLALAASLYHVVNRLSNSSGVLYLRVVSGRQLQSNVKSFSLLPIARKGKLRFGSLTFPATNTCEECLCYPSPFVVVHEAPLYSLQKLSAIHFQQDFSK